MKTIGITGGSGVGKTAVLSILEKQGCLAIDADAVYHRLLDTNQQMLAEIRQAFPCAFYNGEFFIKALGQVVFKDQDALKVLSGITHKYVLTAIREMIAAADQKSCCAAAVDAAALFESGFDKECDATIGIVSPKDVRIARIVARDEISPEYASLRIMAQQPDSFYTDRCGYIIKNDSDEASLKETTIKIFNQIIKE